MEKEGYAPNNQIKIYTNGVFDLFHYGHVKFLEKCKKSFHFVYLIVGICSDSDVKNAKGKTVMTAEERGEVVKNCIWVDEVIINCKLPFHLEDLDKLGCKYIAHDPEPYPYIGTDDVYGEFKKASRFLPIERSGDISTTTIINRILFDYDIYLERNIIKGLKPKELNVTNNRYFGIKINLMWKNIKLRTSKIPLMFYFIKWRGKSKVLKDD